VQAIKRLLKGHKPLLEVTAALRCHIGRLRQRGAQIDRLVGDEALGVAGECPRADPGCPPCPSS
jgi:hypothetical protein